MNSARCFRVHRRRRRRRHHHHDHDCFLLLTIERMSCQQALRPGQFLVACLMSQSCIVNHGGTVNKISTLNYLMAKSSISWIYDEFFIE